MIILDCGLTEEFEVGCSLLHVWKKKHSPDTWIQRICALLFFKGALLNDSKGILIQQTENVQAPRQIRFTNVREIVKMKPILKGRKMQAALNGKGLNDG